MNWLKHQKEQFEINDIPEDGTVASWYFWGKVYITSVWEDLFRSKEEKERRSKQEEELLRGDN